MAGARSNKGENNPDGFDYQLCTLLYCILHVHIFQRLRGCKREYEIGSAIRQYGALDDIVLKDVPNNGQEVTYAIQVKNSEKYIDPSYLCDNKKTYVFKYFQSFLEIKKNISVDKIGKLIIWTNMQLAKNLDGTWFESYVPDSQEIDLLGAGSSNVAYKRYRLTEARWKGLQQDFLFRAHPRTIFVELFTDIMFKKDLFYAEGAAKGNYRVMAREIIDCDGNIPVFKNSFITGQGLSEESKRFRESFERIMQEKFKAKKFGAFSMNDLNCDRYKAYFELKVDDKFKDGNRLVVEWKQWKDVPTEDDVKEFFKRFVFYTEVSNLDKLKSYVSKELAQYGSYDQWSTLIKGYAYEKLVKSDQIERLLDLLMLRIGMDCGPFLQLQFNDLDKLEQEISTFFKGNMPTPLCIKAVQNVYCTLARLITVVEKELEPNRNRYLVLSYEAYGHKNTQLEAILEEPELIEAGLKCIIITCMTSVPSNKLEEISKKCSPLKAIFVGKTFDGRLPMTDDEFDVGSIADDRKTKIELTKIRLSSKQCVTAKDIFWGDLFKKENHQIILGLFKIGQSNPIEMKITELDADSHYKTRLVERIKADGKTIGCDLITETNFHRFVICDEAGMGKSTELVRIAVELRVKYPTHLIVYLDCRTVASKWDGSQWSLAKIVFDSLTSKNELNYALVEKMFQRGNIILLMDGYDEVSSKHHKKLEELLAEFSTNKMYKSIRLYIATRPHYLDKIKKKLTGCIECHLKPFSESVQQEYLESYWKKYHENNPVQSLIIENNTRAIISSFRTMFKKQSIIGIPLQTHMIAVIYKDRISEDNFEVPKPHEIGSIYEVFVNLKFEEYIKRFYDMTSAAHESIIDNLRNAFFRDHFQIAQLINRGDPSEALELCTNLQHYGLVRLHPSIGFIHQTYLEYFLTLYFLQYRTAVRGDFVFFMQRHLCESRVSIATKFLDFHIGTMDPNTDLLSSSPNLKAVFPDDFHPPATALLHPDKIREFHLYLRRYCSAVEQCTLIRNCFNISVFNVFEVLYDSLPEDVKSRLRFCFGNRPESNFINLKLLGGNQLLHLLKLLQKKHPDNFVRLHLSQFDDDEEDFIEVSCRKPFVQVLEWLATELFPNLHEKEREALEEYVTRRFTKYFELVVQHNNAEVLKQAIDWIKNNWSVEAAKQFLQDGNVMVHFVENIETKASTKPLKIESRVEMVRLMSDLHQWATLFEGQYTKTVDDLQYAAIKQAFGDTFYR